MSSRLLLYSLLNKTNWIWPNSTQMMRSVFTSYHHMTSHSSFDSTKILKLITRNKNFRNKKDIYYLKPCILSLSKHSGIKDSLLCIIYYYLFIYFAVLISFLFPHHFCDPFCFALLFSWKFFTFKFHLCKYFGNKSNEMMPRNLRK